MEQSRSVHALLFLRKIFIMSNENVFDRARRYLGCHPNASLTIKDAWEIDPDHHECAVVCCRCGRMVQFDISRKEYKHIDNRKPWTLQQEEQDGE